VLAGNCQSGPPAAAVSVISATSISIEPRLVSVASTLTRWPGTTGPGTAAIAWKSIASAVLIASMNCCSLMRRMNTASGSPGETLNRGASPPDHAPAPAPHADGFDIEKAATAACTSRSMAEQRRRGLRRRTPNQR
jgi:hypothetical protein